MLSHWMGKNQLFVHAYPTQKATELVTNGFRHPQHFNSCQKQTTSLLFFSNTSCFPTDFVLLLVLDYPTAFPQHCLFTKSNVAFSEKNSYGKIFIHGI